MTMLVTRRSACNDTYVIVQHEYKLSTAPAPNNFFI